MRRQFLARQVGDAHVVGEADHALEVLQPEAAGERPAAAAAGCSRPSAVPGSSQGWRASCAGGAVGRAGPQAAPCRAAGAAQPGRAAAPGPPRARGRAGARRAVRTGPRPPRRRGAVPHPGFTAARDRAAGWPRGRPAGGRPETSSGSTAYSVSPRTRSGARLVASTVKLGHGLDHGGDRGAASRRCSTLSSTRSGAGRAAGRRCRR